MLYKPFTSPWIGHHANRILITSYAVYLAYAAGDTLFEIPFGFAFWFNVVWMATAMHAVIALLRHDRGPLCGRCISEMPLDPSARAERYRRNLATMHWISAHPRGWIAGSVLIFVLIQIGISTDLIPIHAVALLLTGPAIWIFLSISRHSQLQPWCPQCRGNGGGDASPVDGPKPGLALKT